MINRETNTGNDFESIWSITGDHGTEEFDISADAMGFLTLSSFHFGCFTQMSGLEAIALRDALTRWIDTHLEPQS